MTAIKDGLTKHRSMRGQVLPIFALFLVVLFAIAALAIDVSGAYSARRTYRSFADGAALAGAQDLQAIGSRKVNPADRMQARRHAMDAVATSLGISTAGLPSECRPTTDIDIDDSCILPGTAYHVRVKAGTSTGPTAIQCQSCDPSRSVQVGLRNASYQLTFARVLGISTWNVGVDSVAGLAFAKAFAIQTLKPPEVTGGGLPTVKDITIDGGTIVTVESGDVGSNANMNYSGTNSVLNLSDGYGMFYFDPSNGPFWSGPPSPPAQTVQKLPVMMNDPGYRYPLMSGSAGTAPTFASANKTDCAIGPTATLACTRADHDPACLAEATNNVPSAYSSFMTTQLLTPSSIYCYNPGIYNTSNSNQLKVGTGDLAILKPGAYYFKSGLDVSGRIIGGYQADQPGVALMFDESGPGNCSSCIFSGNNALTISLNAGTNFPVNVTTGGRAKAAIDWDNQAVETSGPSSPDPALPLTILVLHDLDGAGGTTGCYVPVSPQILLEPATCHDNKNGAINIAGNGEIILEGVQYAPSDNVVIGGNSSSTGRVGQIIAWTLKYSGGIALNQEGPGTEKPGVMRLDAACTAPGTPCNP